MTALNRLNKFGLRLPGLAALDSERLVGWAKGERGPEDLTHEDGVSKGAARRASKREVGTPS